MDFIPIHPNLMANLKYGSVEFYSEQFADLLADVDSDEPDTVDNIIRGFLTSVDEWFDYHERQADAYAKLRERVREALAV